MNIQSIIGEMTLKDKISLCTGADFWHSKAMEQYVIPSFLMADGPHGLRCQSGKADMIGVNESLPATCFPAAVTAGAAWNPELYAAEAAAIGQEAIALGVDVVLGPGCNIKRDPRCGRNFEYLSEDPYLAGKLAAAFIRGLQSTGVSASLKHFAVNNQEYKRQNGDSQVDERALREIYLAPFETAVKEGKPDTVMCSYNKINGVHASDNHWLLTEILREEWGFDGMVITDWGALSDRIEGFKAGCDLNMPGGSCYMEKATLEAVKRGELDEKDVDASVERILRLALQSAERKKENTFDMNGHHALACRVAEAGAVLLKNEEGILPVKLDDMVLIGSMAKDFRYQGSGSSHINPTKYESLTDAIPGVPYTACGDKSGKVSEAELFAAVQAAKAAKVAVVVAGLPDAYESEGFDRTDMAMPEGHIRMIEAVAVANPNTVVVLLGGSPMELPWCEKVKAILYMGLPGQAGSEACVNLLTGKAVPSGKLTESWPMTYRDTVTRETFGQKNVEYRESIYVGYRYYDKAKKAMRFPFGHGLSYTTFAYSNLEIKDDAVSFTVTNTGTYPGAEIAQMYITPPKGGLHRPEQELKGFQRVELAPGKSKQICLRLNHRSFAVWDNDWKIPGGVYEIRVGTSSRDIRLSGTLEVTGDMILVPDWQEGSWYEIMKGTPSRTEWEKAMGHPVPVTPEPQKGQFTLDSTCMEMKGSSLVIKIQYKVTESTVAKSFGGKRITAILLSK